MSRAQQGDIEKTETGNSATATTSATTSQAAEQADINQNQSQLAKFAANNPYVQGGTMETATNRVLSNTADATAQAAAEKGQQMAQRTGQNPGAAVAAGEAEQQAAQRTLGGAEAGATESRLAAGAKYGQDVLAAGQGITAQQAALSSNLTGEAQGQANTAEQAAQTPSFLDELGQGLITGADNLAGNPAVCPARGTLIMMADGGEKLVQELSHGEQIAGLDGEPETIEEITTAIVPVVKVLTEDGFLLRCSLSHSFAVPFGGFIEAAEATGRTILTGNGVSPVRSVDPDGMAQVFNIVTDGTHTYRSNMMWSVGMGVIERAAQIGTKSVEVGG